MNRISLYLCGVFCCLVGTSYAVTPGTDVQPSTSSVAASNLVAVTLTAQDWQEVRTARQAALKAHPELLERTAKLAAQMRAFQDELNAAIIKDDPRLEAIISKMSNRHTGPEGNSARVLPNGKSVK